MTDETNAYFAGDSRGQWFIIAEGKTVDESNVSGRWIKTQDPVDLGVEA